MAPLMPRSPSNPIIDVGGLGATRKGAGGENQMGKAVIPLARPTLTHEMEEAALQALRNEKFVLGESVFKFEDEFARYVGVDYAIAVNSGTMALQLALEVLGVGGRRVLTSPMSFIATANAVLHAGGTPVFADCLPNTGLIDPGAVGASMEGVGVLLPVHLYGTPADMAALEDLSGPHRIPIVEDACQAHGARFGGKRAGSLGLLGCFSFYSTKNLTVGGDGGMITTNDGRLAERLRRLRDCGRVAQYEHTEIGYTARLNSINAAIGRVQLRHLEVWNERRRAIASRYIQGCRDIDYLSLPEVPPGCEPVYHLFPILTDYRDGVQGYLAERRVATGIHYPIPVHLQPIYRKLFDFREGDYPRAEAHARRVLTLPMYPELKDEEVDYILEQLAGFRPGRT